MRGSRLASRFKQIRSTLKTALSMKTAVYPAALPSSHCSILSWFSL